MTMRQWLRRGAAVGLAFALAAPLEAQLRPVPRPADLVISPPAELMLPGAAASPHVASRVTDEPVLGRETKLPLPRFVSLKTNEGNVRRGPSLDHRIDWVFVREDMPLQITAEYDNWRRVQDRDGEGGWIHYSLLSGTRTVIITQDRLPLRSRADDGAQEIALFEANVVAWLEACTIDWCQVRTDDYSGWASKSALWGVSADEVLD